MPFPHNCGFADVRGIRSIYGSAELCDFLTPVKFQKMVSERLVKEHIKQLKGASVKELRSIQKGLPKRDTADTLAKKKAIIALLA